MVAKCSLKFWLAGYNKTPDRVLFFWTALRENKVPDISGHWLDLASKREVVKIDKRQTITLNYSTRHLLAPGLTHIFHNEIDSH